MLIETNSKLVMIGDSITDCGRSRPIGEMAFNGLGNGFVNIVNGILTATHPEKKIRIYNMGIGGNTIKHLEERWQTDVINIKPDWLSIMIGINDVWRHFDAYLENEVHIPLELYEEKLENLVKTTKPALKGLVMMTPYMIEPNKSDAMRSMMDLYGAVVARIANKYGAIFIDIQAEFDKATKVLHPMSIANDRIHPNTVGHSIIARAFLTAIGYKWL